MDRFATMATFVKVAQAEGFSAAARALNTSPSRVTTQVQRLEHALGVRLLNRTTRSVKLTEVGRGYYERCIHILADLADAEQTAQGLQTTPRGILRLNAPMTMPHLINPVIDEYATLHPHARVEMIVTDRMANLVEQGFDLAVQCTPIAESSLIVRRLAVHRLVICGAPSYLAAHGTPHHPSDLAHHNCLVLTSSPWGAEWPFTDEAGSQRIAVSGNLRSNCAAGLRLAALRGQGLLAAPSFQVEDDVAAGRLIPVLTEHAPEEIAILAIYPHRHQLSAKVRCFIDLLAAHLRRGPESGARLRVSTPA